MTIGVKLTSAERELRDLVTPTPQTPVDRMVDEFSKPLSSLLRKRVRTTDEELEM